MNSVAKILIDIFEDNVYGAECRRKAVEALRDRDTFKTWFRLYKNGSPKQLATVLKIFGVYSCFPVPEYAFDEIQIRWDEYLAHNPEELPELLRVYFQLGQFDRVRVFFQQKSGDIASLDVKTYRPLLDEFIEIAEQACAEDCLIQMILQRAENPAYRIYPRVFMKALYNSLSESECMPDFLLLEEEFFHPYEENLFVYTEESVNLLYYLVKDQQIVETIDADAFSEACLCNLEYYMFILDKSVNAAAHALQIWFDCGKIIQKMKLSGEPVKKEEYSELFDQDIRLRFCAEKCFDKALIIRNPADEDALIDLMHSMDSDMKRSLQYYFADRYFYFGRYSRRLVQELARIYNWPENNTKRNEEKNEQRSD